ncbi:MAG: hypothetical protein MK033_01385 [Candidatus Caenarcaniphilales bacterium]|nr:hypothetical protein [Candidatus Caenarcaniphilales bacterium]
MARLTFVLDDFAVALISNYTPPSSTISFNYNNTNQTLVKTIDYKEPELNIPGSDASQKMKATENDNRNNHTLTTKLNAIPTNIENTENLVAIKVPDNFNMQQFENIGRELSEELNIQIEKPEEQAPDLSDFIDMKEINQFNNNDTQGKTDTLLKTFTEVRNFLNKPETNIFGKVVIDTMLDSLSKLVKENYDQVIKNETNNNSKDNFNKLFLQLRVLKVILEKQNTINNLNPPGHDRHDQIAAEGRDIIHTYVGKIINQTNTILPEDQQMDL